MAKKKKKKNKEKEEEKKEDNKDISEGPLRKIKIKVIGIGGGGGSIVSEISTDLKKVSFLVANTDASALDSLGKKRLKRMQFGKKLTEGLGTGMDPKVGRGAALEAEEEIEKAVAGQDINILVSCLGGGTGSGALPVFAEKSRKANALTYGIFTLPFEFEGQRKMAITKKALKKASPYLNAVSILPNENIFKIVDRTTPLKKALSEMNKNLAFNLEGLIETIYEAGLINIDFADIRTILKEEKDNKKLAYLSTTLIKKEEEDAKEIVQKAISNPLYPHGIDMANGILFNITGDKNLGLSEISAISKEISGFTEGGGKVIFGVSQKDNFKGRMKISLLATGCGANYFSEEISATSDQEMEEDEDIEKITIDDDLDQALDDENQEDEEQEEDKEEKPKREQIKIKTIEDEEMKEDEKVEEREERAKKRRNGVEAKKAQNEEEKEILEEEEKWETPTFLRKALHKNDKKDKKDNN